MLKVIRGWCKNHTNGVKITKVLRRFAQGRCSWLAGAVYDTVQPAPSSWGPTKVTCAMHFSEYFFRGRGIRSDQNPRGTSKPGTRYCSPLCWHTTFSYDYYYVLYVLNKYRFRPLRTQHRIIWGQVRLKTTVS